MPNNFQDVTHIENTKKKSPGNGDHKPKKANAGSKPQTMMTAFIRVTKVNYTGEDKKTVVTFSEAQIKDILDEWAFTAGIEYWFIDHTPDDDDPNDHFHIVIKFRSAAHFETIKNKFPFGYIETAKNIRRAVQYLVHLNNPEKLQYTWDQVITNCQDLTPYKVLSRSQQEVCLQRIFEKIEAGEINQYNYDKEIPMDVYARHRTSIVNAFQYKTDQIISHNRRNITVLYFYGKTGIGKTSYALDYCKAVYPNEEPCLTSSSNDPLQDYKGQKSMIWDDFRDSQFRFADLLKFLDPHTRSSGKSRYTNKHFLGDLIIITSTQRLDYLYKGCDNNSEDLMQLRRRISQYHEFVEDKIRIYLYDGNNHYKFFKEHLNPYYGMEIKPKVESSFDLTVYEKMGISLVDPTSKSSDYINNDPHRSTEPPLKKDPISGCEVVPFNGSRSSHPSLTQIKIS